MFGWKQRALRIDITVGNIEISHPNQVKQLLEELTFVEASPSSGWSRFSGWIKNANGKTVGHWQIADFEVDPEEL